MVMRGSMADVFTLIELLFFLQATSFRKACSFAIDAITHLAYDQLICSWRLRLRIVQIWFTRDAKQQDRETATPR